MKTTDLGAILNALYASEINVSIASFWDGGWEVKIGDDLNGYAAGADIQNVSDIAPWLIENARRLHPGSAFAKSFKVRA